MAGNKKRLHSTPIPYVAFGIILISLMTILGAGAFLRTNEIRVEGVVMYSPEDIVLASGISAGDNLLFISAQNVSQNIRAALPFVNSVQVTRALPNTVHIEVTESVAVAAITFAGEIYVIDSSGRVLARLPIATPELEGVNIGDLIEMRGVDIEETAVGNLVRPVFGSETKVQYMQDILIALERDNQIGYVSYLDVSNIVNVFFGYQGIYRVILGGSTSLRPSNLRHKIGMLEDSVNQLREQFPNIPGRILWEHETGRATFAPD
ncbi:MAG: FtsQ-type POTRA domain-containing protein [Oscillospiraceae bacterium]|nr:FtsQ-type POTRA domain-containing protein [Oscillospiraceae bacterium]